MILVRPRESISPHVPESRPLGRPSVASALDEPWSGAYLAQATSFGRETMLFASVLLSVVLFIGLATFVRSVAINYEDARWVAGMNLLRRAYLQMLPELEPYFLTGHDPDADQRPLGHGSPQRRANLAASLTTTTGVVATLNSVLVGALIRDVAALFGAGLAQDAIIGVAASLLSGALHVRYATRFRRRHAPSPAAVGQREGS